MIQTTKDADKAKTSQRQRVDDQNDRFVSRNCHAEPLCWHALPSAARVLGVIPLFLQRFPGFAAWCPFAVPGCAALGLIFIPHTFDKINTALFLWLMI
jgi:hypothetical protein